MNMNIVTYNDTVILAHLGTFEETLAIMEKSFGDFRMFNVASGRGYLKYGNRTFGYRSINPDVVVWDMMKWGLK